MPPIRNSLVGAILRSLHCGKSLLQALLAFWFGSISASKTSKLIISSTAMRTVEDFLHEAEDILLSQCQKGSLLRLCELFQEQFRQSLATGQECMLPSYNYRLPSGDETGTFLALDMGGSTLRAALVVLRGREAPMKERCEIVQMDTYPVDDSIRNLSGMAFFEWMAQCIARTISGSLRNRSPFFSGPIPMSLAWSFPIEQTSLRGGLIHNMGKGFLGSDGLLGQDLGDILQTACKSQGLDIDLQVIVNDSAACLLSQSYNHLTTRFGLILGTGVNIAAHIPVSAIGRSKFGQRPKTWWNQAHQVIVNTELSMYGKDILPMTRWDQSLKSNHPKPDFQPLEQMVGGMYLGEICRFALLEAIETAGLMGGIVPPSLKNPYSLTTQTLAEILLDTSECLETARRLFAERHPSPVPPAASDLAVMQSLAAMIARRSSVLVSNCVYALWDLRRQSLVQDIQQGSDEARSESLMPLTVVSVTGSVIEKFPGFLDNCREHLGKLLALRKDENQAWAIDLVEAQESSIIGAAVALACVEA